MLQIYRQVDTFEFIQRSNYHIDSSWIV